jgi:hypothetical protein
LARRLSEFEKLNSMKDPKAGLFYGLGRIFEELHPEQQFAVSNERPEGRAKSIPSGPAFRWCQALLQQAALRFGKAIPELADLQNWAASHPDGLAMRIRQAKEAIRKAG